MKFKVGDVVQLKSGGPSMTVQEITEEEALCVWFNRAEQMRDSFAAPALQIAPPRVKRKVITRRPKRA